ncbi:MAG: hypothetical protein KGJ49_11175 [Alphaproteobacteria bacterium]|nr:hypothetical protein [Alphaproteobacteria bacterium]
MNRSSKMMNRMANRKLSLALQIEEWTREALVRWGDDWPRINDYIRARLAGMSAGERATMTAEAQLTLLGKQSDMSTH